MPELQKFSVIELNLTKIMQQSFWTTIILSIIFVAFNISLNGFNYHFSIGSFIGHLSLFSLLYIVLIIFHEICHLIGFIIFGKVPFHSLKYGVNLKLGVAYATTLEILPASAMKKALLLPFWVTGVLPTLMAFYIDSNTLAIVGAFLIAGAMGDFAMYAALLKYPKNCWIKDDLELPKLHLYRVK